MSRKVYKRLQGAEWHSMKDRLQLISYKIDNNNYIKGFYKGDEGKLYSHWMNDQEREEFFKDHKPKVNKYSITTHTYNLDLLEEYHRLRDNWNELRKMIEDSIIALHKYTKDPTDNFVTTSAGTFGRVLNMMDELEGNMETTEYDELVEKLEEKYVGSLTPDNTRVTAVYIDRRSNRQDMNRVMDEYGNMYFISELEGKDESE